MGAAGTVATAAGLATGGAPGASENWTKNSTVCPLGEQMVPAAQFITSLHSPAAQRCH